MAAVSEKDPVGRPMVLNVLSLAMAGTAIPLTGAPSTRKIFALASMVGRQARLGYQTASVE